MCLGLHFWGKDIWIRYEDTIKKIWCKKKLPLILFLLQISIFSCDKMQLQCRDNRLKGEAPSCDEGEYLEVGYPTTRRYQR